jgi:hypothetical protein
MNARYKLVGSLVLLVGDRPLHASGDCPPACCRAAFDSPGKLFCQMHKIPKMVLQLIVIIVDYVPEHEAQIGETISFNTS